MENNENLQEQAQIENEELPQDQAQIQNGEELPRRGPGRPRGAKYGKPWVSKANPNDPISMARAAAGRKGHATVQSRIQTEAYRKKHGRLMQAELDQELAALRQELKTYQYAEKTLDQQDTAEFVEHCQRIGEDCIWNRKWPIERDNFYDELENQVPQEERQFCSWWPEIAVTDVVIMARYVMAPDRPGLQKLVVKTMEQFLEWSKTQTADADFENAVKRVKLLLPKVQDGTIYLGPCYDDPRLEPPEKPRPLEEVWAERRQWERQGRDADAFLTRAESEQERRLRQERELEIEVIRKKEADDAKALENSQRHLLGFDVNVVLHGGDVFGVRPTRHSQPEPQIHEETQ